MSNQSYHHGDLKAELIRTGLKLLVQDGYEGFSLRKVAKACNVSQTAPYRHFKDKDELITAITLEALRAFNECLEQAVIDNPEDPKKQLSEMGIAYVHFFMENPEYMRLLFLSNMIDKMNHYYGSNKDQIQDSYPFQIFNKTIERYKSAYPEMPMNKDEMLLYSWGLVHGISMLLINKDFQIEGDYMALIRKVLEY